MFPNTQQSVKRYSDALGFAPLPGFPSRWPPGTGPRQTPAQRTRNFHAPMPVRRTLRHRAAGLGDGDGLGDVSSVISSIFSPAVNAVVAPAEQQLADLKTAIKAILVFSAIAAGTGVINVLRR